MAQKSENRANLFRLQMLIIDGGNLVVRHLVDQTLADRCITLSAFLNSENTLITRLKRRQFITQEQYDILFPIGDQVPTTADMDFYLIVFLLRNLHIFGMDRNLKWHATRSQYDVTRVTAICRLIDYRKKISHIAETTGIQANDFVTWWKDIEQILVRLSPPALNIQQIIDDLRVCSLDPEREKIVQEETVKRVYEELESCLSRIQIESLKFDGRLIQLEEKQTAALGLSLDVKEIGKGAHGYVYRSTDSEMFGIPVAVKQILTITDALGKKHARMEMMANRLMSPFILPLIASAKTSIGDIWLITPYCENGDLEKAIKDGKASKDKMKINMQMPRVRIALQIALAIQYIHTEVPNVRGCILHKDIASSNIVLDKNLNTRLIDFGLAREKNDPSQTYSVKDAYKHPQEGHGDSIKESLDYYKFGIIILELLTSLGPLGENLLYLKNMNEKQIREELDTHVWVDKEIMEKLYNLSKKCLKEFKWTIEDFSTNVIEPLQEIMRTGDIDIYEGQESQEEACHHCIINPITKNSSLTGHYANCKQKIEVCIACEKNSILYPVTCYCGATLKSKIGSNWGALLVAGDDENPEKAAAMKREILELERVVTSKAPRIIGISKCNVKTVVPDNTKTENKKEETPTWTKIKEHIAHFAKDENIDTLLVYFSCHGANGEALKGCSDKNMFQLGKSSELISLGDFQKEIDKLNKKVILFLDRCFPPMVEFKDNIKEFIQINACSEGQKAVFTDKGSLFTQCVIQGLKARSEKEECSKDCKHCLSYWEKRTEYISIESLSKYVNKHVKLEAPHPKKHVKITEFDIAFFTEEVVNIEFTTEIGGNPISLPLRYLSNIDEVKRMLLEFNGDTEKHEVKIEKDIFRNDQEAYGECTTLEQVMEAWINRFPLHVSFLEKEET